MYLLVCYLAFAMIADDNCTHLMLSNTHLNSHFMSCEDFVMSFRIFNISIKRATKAPQRVIWSCCCSCSCFCFSIIYGVGISVFSHKNHSFIYSLTHKKFIFIASAHAAVLTFRPCMNMRACVSLSLHFDTYLLNEIQFIHFNYCSRIPKNNVNKVNFFEKKSEHSVIVYTLAL